MFLLRRIGAAITVAGVLAPTTEAVALWDDRLELFVSETVTWDDNVFRLSNDSDPEDFLGSPSKGDTYFTTSFGFNLDVPVGRQRLVGSFALNRTRYDRFGELELDDGRNGRAMWVWQVGNQLSGELGYTESLTLASLANVQSGIQSSTPNFVELKRTFFNAAYRPAARWQIRGDVSRLEQSNSAAERRLSDASIDGAELTVSYVSRADNQLGLSARLADGSLPNGQPVATVLVDNSYRQRNFAAVLDWTMTAHSRVTARAGRTTRSYTQLPQRDFEGWTYQASYEWKPRAKFVLTASAQRDISTTEEVNVGFVLAKGVALYPALRLTEKIDLTAALEQFDRDYLGDPGLVLGTVSPRSERIRAAGLAVSYRPARPVTLNLTWRRETRSSAVDFGDYAANIASLGVRISF